jgi:2-oxoglutarate dehydrogenase E2 component (dihydrolipoamide succinyltransferase)
MATETQTATDVVVPPLGESIQQATLLKWHKSDGQAVEMDEMLCELETDKTNVDLPSPAAGILRTIKKEGDPATIGEVVGRIEPSGATAAKPATPVRKPPLAVPPPPAAPAPAKALVPVPPPPPVPNPSAKSPAPSQAAPPPASPAPPQRIAAPASPPAEGFDSHGIRREPLSKIRRRIAQTLVEAQHTAAILTTFNEIDMTGVMELRTRYKDRFQELHGVGLGFMSFFARAVVVALREFPRVNAFLEGDDAVYHSYVHLGIAVSTDRGLAVPVLKNVQDMTFSRIESEIKRLANATREGKVLLDDLSGGTFTITNGGIFGSLLSTPILTPPQSGILGMHAIQKRPMVVNDKIEIRSMMYVALSYDHRLVDGRESVGFLVRIKQLIEDPARLMLEV